MVIFLVEMKKMLCFLEVAVGGSAFRICLVLVGMMVVIFLLGMMVVLCFLEVAVFVSAFRLHLFPVGMMMVLCFLEVAHEDFVTLK